MRHCRKQLLRVTVQGAIWVWGRTNNGLRFFTKTEQIGCTYIKKDLLQGIGSWDYGGWQAPRSARRVSKVRCRRGVVTIWVWSPENQESWWFSSSLKLASSRASVSVQRQSGRRNSYLGESQPFLFCSGLQLIGGNPPTLESAICFTQSILNLSLTQKHPQKHPEKCLTKYLGIPWPSQYNTKN